MKKESPKKRSIFKAFMVTRLARFERAAFRLGVLNLVLGLSSSEIVKALFFNAGIRQTAFWRSSEIVCFCQKNPSIIRWRLDDRRKLLGPFRHLTFF